MAGLLGDSWDDPRTAAVFAGLQGLLGGRNALTGLLGGGAAYTQQMAQAKQAQQMQEMQKLQLAQHQMALQQAQQAAAKQQALQALIPQFSRNPAQTAMAGGGGPSLENAAKMDGAGPSFDFNGYAQALAGIDPNASLAMQAALKKEQPKIKEFKEVRTPQGVRIVGLDEYGKPVDTGQTPFKDAQEMDLGGVKALRDPITNEIVQQYRKSMSPDAVASNGLGWANFSNAKERLAFDKTQAGKPQFHDGQWLTPPDASNPSGTSVAVPGYSKPLTEFQGKATTFASRMMDAEKVLNEMEKKGVSGSDLRTMAAGSMWTNPAAAAAGQQYRQAQENWVTANLRQESGAAIGVDEMNKDIKKYFPIPGDSQEVRDQKAQARAVATKAMMVQAGPGANQVSNILRDAAASTGPKVGQVLKGYRFKGGDPADKSNWEPAQ